MSRECDPSPVIATHPVHSSCDHPDYRTKRTVDRFIHTHTHPFNGPSSGTTRVSRYQKGKSNLDFTGTRDSEWQWHQLGHMQVCTSLQTDNHASTPPICYLQARCPSCRPTNSVKALKAHRFIHTYIQIYIAPKIVRTCSNRSISLGGRAHSSKPAAADGTDRQMDRRSKVA